MSFVSQLSAKQTEVVLKMFPSVLADYLRKLQDFNSPELKEFKSLKVGEKNERLLGEGLKAIEQCYLTTTPDKAIIESHHNYIDFQLLIEGQELMHTVHVSKLQMMTPYQSEKDLVVYQESPELHQLKMSAYDYAIFMPEDAHRSTLILKSEVLVRKVVIKIPV